MTTANDLLVEATARLQAVSLDAAYPTPENVLREHATPPTLEQSPRIHVEDGDERITGRAKNDCDVDVSMNFTVCIYVRSDVGFAAIDPVVAEVYRRLNDAGSPHYPHNARLEPGDIRVDSEIADNDSVNKELSFTFKYSRAKWVP